MQLSERDLERARKWWSCKCHDHDDFTYFRDIYQCNKCGFKWDRPGMPEKDSKKLSKSDQLCNKD